MRVRMTMTAVVLAVSGLSVTACEFPSACEGLKVSEQDREAVANGYEVERDDKMGNECELSEDGNSWSVDE